MQAFHESFTHLAGLPTASGAAITNLTWSIPEIIGLILMMILTGLHSVAGLGGGAPNVVVLILLFGMVPKQSTIAVFACIFGSALGNMINQMQRVVENKPVVNYRYASITIPLVFIGALFGVMINQFLPSIATVTIIIGVNCYKMPGMLIRFKKQYAKESQELANHQLMDEAGPIIQETKVNPFSIPYNIRIFQQLLLLIILYAVLSFIRGSLSLPSLIGVPICSPLYWVLEMIIILLALAFFENSVYAQRRQIRNQVDNNEEQAGEDKVKQKECMLTVNSLAAGVVGGLGLGGGVLLVPLYRQLGLSPVSASSTSAFTVFVISGINVTQAFFLGKLGLVQFLTFFGFTFVGSYFMSLWLSAKLRQMHRTSIVELMLFVLTIVISLCLALSLWLKVNLSGGNTHLIFGFGNVC